MIWCTMTKLSIRITHDHHFFKEEIENGVLSFSYVSTEIQANIVMKAQSKLGFDWQAGNDKHLFNNLRESECLKV